jgi:type IV secretion system protein TrbJ
MTNSSPSRSRSSLRTILAAGLVLAGAVLMPSRASAQFGLLGSGIVFDPSNFARNVLHYARRLEQMDLQRRQLQQQLTAMQKLHNPNWRQIDATLLQIRALTQQGQALAYSLNTIDAEFRRTFPGSQVFQDYPGEQKMQLVRTLATMRGALDAVSRSAQDYPTSVARLQAMKQQFGSIQGHESALELNGTIGMYSAEELTMLHQAISELTNVQAVYYAHQVNTEAQRQATFRERLMAMSGPGTNYEPISLRVAP